MARRLRNIPVRKQIRGVKKALESPRTPAHLRPGLRKRLDQLRKGRPLSGLRGYRR